MSGVFLFIALLQNDFVSSCRGKLYIVPPTSLRNVMALPAEQHVDPYRVVIILFILPFIFMLLALCFFTLFLLAFILFVLLYSFVSLFILL